MGYSRYLALLAVGAVAAGGIGGLFVACGGSSAESGDASAEGGGEGGTVDANLSPDGFNGNGMCLKLGSACKSSGDCCFADCSGGVCSYPQCTANGAACSSNGECCSQICTAGKCASLGSNCTTLGNPCGQNGDCCSGRCAGGTCEPSSFCNQQGDICAINSDCCTGVCTLAQGQNVGTCGAPPSGPANCKMPDGTLCGGSGADGGVVYNDAGLPACGGGCCSRACAPFGPTGILVCQPASGCKPVGDLCTKDDDCCGASGILGGSMKPVTCDFSGGGSVGICRNPMGCKPNGDVCKLKTMSCNSSCDCCAGNCETMDTCKQDNLGVPRCANLNCQDAGASCASSADCCNGMPCVPNPVDGGQPPYTCYPSTCVPNCGTCTNNADCCPGESCNTTTHQCDPCGGDGGPPPPPPDGGFNYDGGGYGDGGCTSQYGQICTQNSDCCGGVPCLNGFCRYPQ
jgi:hypothetical protein